MRVSDCHTIGEFGVPVRFDNYTRNYNYTYALFRISLRCFAVFYKAKRPQNNWLARCTSTPLEFYTKTKDIFHFETNFETLKTSSIQYKTSSFQCAPFVLSSIEFTSFQNPPPFLYNFTSSTWLDSFFVYSLFFKGI